MKTRNTLFVLAFLSISAVFGQKKTNGKIYIEHPAITVVQDFVKASVAGDTTKMANLMTDDFKAYNGTANNPTGDAMDEAAFLKNSMLYHDQLDYFSIEPFPGSYPDALHYKDENQNGNVAVLTWDLVKGMHKTTGVKIDAATHRQYDLNKDNKIQRVISYRNGSVIDEIRDSFADRANGTIYNHHENINTVRKMIHAFEHKDLEKAYSFYDENARFADIHTSDMKGIFLAEQKARDTAFLDEFEVSSIDMVGYPDYLHYEMGDARVVQSWWNFNLVRKSDQSAVKLPILFINDFNADGKIIYETAYFSEKVLEGPSKVVSN